MPVIMFLSMRVNPKLVRSPCLVKDRVCFEKGGQSPMRCGGIHTSHDTHYTISTCVSVAAVLVVISAAKEGRES